MTTPPPGYPPQYPPQPPAVTPQGRPLAEFSDRLLAYIIDSAIIMGALLVVAIPAFIWFFNQIRVPFEEMQQTQPGDALTVDISEILVPELILLAIVAGSSLIFSFVYYVPLMREGQTVGKRVMRIRVVHLVDGSTATTATCAKRWGITLLCGFVPLGSYLDGLWQLWDKPFQQTLHDKAVGTAVVKVGV